MPRGAEVDVLGVVLAVERRREQAHHVHARAGSRSRPAPAPRVDCALRRAGARPARRSRGAADGSASGARCGWPRGWRYWMSFCRFITCHIVSGSLPVRVPDVHREHQRVCARVVVEHRLDRRVGVGCRRPSRARRRCARPGKPAAARPRPSRGGRRAACRGCRSSASRRCRRWRRRPSAGSACVDQLEIDQLAQRRRAAAPCRSSRRASGPSGTCGPRKAIGLGWKKRRYAGA